MDVGLEAQRDGVARIGDDAAEHQEVAEIDIEGKQACEFAVAGGKRNARDRDEEAGDLRQGRAQAEEQEIGDEDQHRDASLFDADVDRRGVDTAE